MVNHLISCTIWGICFTYVPNTLSKSKRMVLSWHSDFSSKVSRLKKWLNNELELSGYFPWNISMFRSISNYFCLCIHMCVYIFNFISIGISIFSCQVKAKAAASRSRASNANRRLVAKVGSVCLVKVVYVGGPGLFRSSKIIQDHHHHHHHHHHRHSSPVFNLKHLQKGFLTMSICGTAQTNLSLSSNKNMSFARGGWFYANVFRWMTNLTRIICFILFGKPREPSNKHRFMKSSMMLRLKAGLQQGNRYIYIYTCSLPRVCSRQTVAKSP